MWLTRQSTICCGSSSSIVKLTTRDTREEATKPPGRDAPKSPFAKILLPNPVKALQLPT
jgi:hypothetical protein